MMENKQILYLYKFEYDYDNPFLRNIPSHFYENNFLKINNYINNNWAEYVRKNREFTAYEDFLNIKRYIEKYNLDREFLNNIEVLEIMSETHGFVCCYVIIDRPSIGKTTWYIFSPIHIYLLENYIKEKLKKNGIFKNVLKYNDIIELTFTKNGYTEVREFSEFSLKNAIEGGK